MARLHQENVAGAPLAHASRGVLALSLEFVAKPNATAGMKSHLPLAITRTLGEVSGFAGSVVLISDQESRLVTVITFWFGQDRVMRCAENRRWLQALLKPYIDGCLRGRTHFSDGYQMASAGLQAAKREVQMGAAKAEEAFAA